MKYAKTKSIRSRPGQAGDPRTLQPNVPRPNSATNRAVNRMIETVMTPYWTMTRGLDLAVRAIVIESPGRVLLLRRPNVPEWELPGGHVAWHETPATSLDRELRALGVSMSEPPELKGITPAVALYRGAHVCEYLVQDWTHSHSHSHPQPHPPGRSAAQSEFVSLDDLPEAIDALLAARLREFFSTGPVT